MINIVGLGATDKYGLTLEAVEAVKNGNKNFIRTVFHEAVKYFEDEKIEFTSFDYLYEEKNSFEEVYTEIVEVLLNEAKDKDINYFVPGNPLIAESTVVKLMEKTQDYNIIMGMSFIEPVLRAVKRDPSKGLLLIDGDDFNPLDIDVKCDVIITQVYNNRIAVDLKLALSEIYGDEYKIYLITDAGLRDEYVCYVPIYELDRIENINHQSAIYIPKCNDIKNFRDIILKADKNIVDFKNKEDIEVDVDRLITDAIDVINRCIILNDEGLYYFYEILEQLDKKLTKNREFLKNSVEKTNNIGYNDNSLRYNNGAFVDSLKNFSGSSINRAASVIDSVVSIGFVWDDVNGVLEKVAEELNELKLALNSKNSREISEEVGDLIFTSVNLCRFLKEDPSQVLDSTTNKFIERFSVMSKLASEHNMDLKALKLNELEDLYNEAKEILKTKNNLL